MCSTNPDKVAQDLTCDALWKFAQDYQIDWTPGTPGKGILLRDGSVFTWSDSGNPDQDITHVRYAQEHGINLDEFRAAFYIDPDGGVRAWMGNTLTEQEKMAIAEGDSRLNVGAVKPNIWDFTSSDEHDVLDWDEGQEGRGIIDRNGHVHTWDSEEFDTHQSWLAEHPEILPMKYFWIAPDGKCSGSGLMEALDDMDEEVLRDADPRLYVVPEEANVWNFSQPATM